MVKSYELFEKKQNEKSKKCDHVTVEFMIYLVAYCPPCRHRQSKAICRAPPVFPIILARSPRDYKKVHVFLVYKLQNRYTEYVESL